MQGQATISFVAFFVPGGRVPQTRIGLPAAGPLWSFSAVTLFELKVEIPPSCVDVVDSILLERGFGNWNVLDDVGLRRAWVSAICSDEAEAKAQWGELQPAFAAGAVTPITPLTLRELGDADWRDSYKAHFHAWHFGRLHWVPVWERGQFALPPGHAVLWLDPGLAFGTGNHETTRLCVERLVGLAELHGSAGRVVDAGCGSGILALSAALLGFVDVNGFDNDPEAVRVSEENAVLNNLEQRVRFRLGDLTTGLASEAHRADVLLANIQADVLIRFASELVAAVAPAGCLVLSGILAAENAEVLQVFAALTPGWASDARIMGEWSDLQFTRPR